LEFRRVLFRSQPAGHGRIAAGIQAGHQPQHAGAGRHRNLRRDRRTTAARRPYAGCAQAQRRNAAGARNLPARHRRRSLYLRSGRRAAALCARLPRSRGGRRRPEGGLIRRARLHTRLLRNRSRMVQIIQDGNMAHAPQIRIPATYMRGGTSKGVFFKLTDLPHAAQAPGPDRDALLLRVIGSPDPYGKQIDGMGGATSSTSKTVILSRSSRPGHDVDYLFGQVSIDRPFVDWSGNCGNLSAAVGPYAIANGLVDPERVPRDGVAVVRIWQANIGKTIVSHVPMSGGLVQETGDFELDGVTFPAAEVRLEFMDPADEGEEGGAMFPTGNVVDELDVPGVCRFRATFVSSGIPTFFRQAEALGYWGAELQDDIKGAPAALGRFEAIGAQGACRMGLFRSLEEAAAGQHTPKVAFVA